MNKLLSTALFLASTATFANAPGAPGVVPNWSSAKKVQAATSADLESKVWFTNAQGMLTETYYPNIDNAQIKDSQILVSDESSFMVEERTSTIQKVEVLSPSLVKMTNIDTGFRFQIEHTYYTIPGTQVLVDKVRVEAYQDGLSFHLLVNPALENTGYNDNGYAHSDKLEFKENQTRLIVRSTSGFDRTSVGFVGFSDGWQDLNDNFEMNWSNSNAVNGNVAGMGKLSIPAQKGTYEFYVTYNFAGDNQFNESYLASGMNQYNDGWNKLIDSYKLPKLKNQAHKELYKRSIFTLRVHEDKEVRGAMIASLSKPWGDETFEYPGVFTGGYHLVWPRDLFHVGLALVSAGDLDTPLRALRFLKSVQYQSGEWRYGDRVIAKKGAFPQNVWTDGNAYWSGLQLDQVGYPVQLFAHLYRNLPADQRPALVAEFEPMVRLGLDFIVNYGPWSAQERWEENFGISPSTFSVATAALLEGAKLLNEPKYAKIANDWLTKPYDNIHSWTFTTNGVNGGGKYYLRVGGCANYTASWNPNDGSTCTVANSGQQVDMTAMLDQGFLKLALMGLVDANDSRLLVSQKEVNAHIRQKVGEYYGWYRYSFDAYGENKKGRLWPLLSGEHARFALERARTGGVTYDVARREANHILDSYVFFANDGQMIPEQVFEGSGEGTGGATPLAWSHAEYVKLMWSLELNKNVENLLD